MLSSRGRRSAASQSIPWRFAPGGTDRYDPITNPSGVISFATAENNLIHQDLADYIRGKDFISAETFTYRFSTMGGPRFPLAMANHLNKYFAPFRLLQAENIVTAAALTAIHEMVGFSLADPGDGILTTRPVYGRFVLDFGNTDELAMVYADSEGVDPFSPNIVPKLQQTFDNSLAQGRAIKALLIVNPNNPVGACYPRATIEALFRFCQKNSIHLISDEVYGLSVYETDERQPTGFTSVLAVDPTELIDEDRIQVFYGMSKDFGAAGLRVGCLVTRNKKLRTAMAANIRFHASSGPSLAIAATILEDTGFVETIIAKSRSRLAQARRYTCSKLNEANIEYYRGGCAGFFVFVDLSPWLAGESSAEVPDKPEHAQEYALAQKLLDGGVAVHPCEEHFERKGWFRIVFSLGPDVLAEGLRRLVSTLGPRPTSVGTAAAYDSAQPVACSDSEHTAIKARAVSTLTEVESVPSVATVV